MPPPFQMAIFQVSDVTPSFFMSLYLSSICISTSNSLFCSAVELFLPHIAVAFGHAPSFSDPKAQSFSMNKLFEPNFGPDLSVKILESLTANLNLNGVFDRFNSTSSTGLPMDPITFEVFRVEKYLPEIQFSLKLSPSIDFAASNFRTSDLYDAMFPTSIPTIKSFGAFIKKNILLKISNALNGLFDAKVAIPTDGLTVDAVSLGGEGLIIGVYTEGSTQLFPPVVDIDKVEVRSPFELALFIMWSQGLCEYATY